MDGQSRLALKIIKKEIIVKNILCFGDSNTYGLKPDGTGRYDFTVRYPGKLQAFLGNDYHIIEEGCSGRTTIYEDQTRPYKKGIDYITPCLHSHIPLDWVIIMLGTNDCKTAHQALIKDIALGLSRIIDAAQAVLDRTTQIMIVAPIHLGDNIGLTEYDPEFDDHSVSVSKGLATVYKLLAQETGCAFLDASIVAKASPIDQEHLDEVGHDALAKALARRIQNPWCEQYMLHTDTTGRHSLLTPLVEKSMCQKSG